VGLPEVQRPHCKSRVRNFPVLGLRLKRSGVALSACLFPWVTLLGLKIRRELNQEMNKPGFCRNLCSASLCRIPILVIAFLVLDCQCRADSHSEWKAGVASISMTPEHPVWLAGYSARTKPSEGTAQGLFAKALALEDPSGNRVVLVTADMLGFPAALSRRVAERVQQKYQLPRQNLMLSASHTHSGPVVSRMLAVAYDMSDEQWLAVDRYTSELEDRIVSLVGKAIQDLVPARLSFGRGEAGFAANRRKAGGPVDHDVPVLRIEGEKGNVRAVVFGYACHNVTLDGDFYQCHGDYAGVAQEWLESRYSGTLAFFVAGCGGDINPKPRGSLAIAREHGEALGKAVDRAMSRSMLKVRGTLRSAWEVFPVRFAVPPDREELQTRRASNDKFIRRHAQEMLKILDRDGRLPIEYPYPLQIWWFGADLTLVALAGEVVVDYTLRLKREIGGQNLWVAAYCNDVFGYVPSLRILREGGYEGGGAMIYYVQPGPFDSSIEETIIRKVHQLLKGIDTK